MKQPTRTQTDWGITDWPRDQCDAGWLNLINSRLSLRPLLRPLRTLHVHANRIRGCCVCVLCAVALTERTCSFSVSQRLRLIAQDARFTHNMNLKGRRVLANSHGLASHTKFTFGSCDLALYNIVTVY